MKVFVGGRSLRVQGAAERALAAWGLRAEPLPKPEPFPGDRRPVTETLGYSWPLYDWGRVQGYWTVWLLLADEPLLAPIPLALLHRLRGGGGPPRVAVVSLSSPRHVSVLTGLGLHV